MNNGTIDKREEIEIDFQSIVGAVWKKNWIISLVSVLCATLSLLASLFLISPKYQSAAMFYVNNNSFSVGETALNITSSDITASKNLVNSYIVILKSRTCLIDVIDYASVNRTYEELAEMITAESVDDTEIFEVIVESTNPQEAEKIANAIAYILPKRISSIIEGTSAKIVDSAVVASKPSSPSYVKNTLLGFVLGIIMSVGVVAFRELFDITIRSEEDITRISKHPVLAAVPDMLSPSKGGYYGYGKERKSSADDRKNKTVLVGKDVNFAAAEAYKLLRTKIQYSFAGEHTCRVIGISSAMTGEGKSLTAVNLAFTLSELGLKVVLIDCDMRRPSLQAKLRIKKQPGLSGFLSGQFTEERLLQSCGLKDNESAFHVIASGQTPPNPVELLSSEKMIKMLQVLRKSYDYIILDLPPIGEVSDALAVAKETDGILLVVRQDYCNRIALSSAIRQFEFVDSRILGITFNCANDKTNGYSKKYYKKYHAYDITERKGNEKSV